MANQLTPGRGRFITFEGGEGVGKSTNIGWCAERLTEYGVDVLVTREPGGTPIAEAIRNKILKAHHEESMSSVTELMLVFAARAQHLDRVIRPALEQGRWVLCDRFTDSTIAYQGYGRGLDLALIQSLKSIVQQDLEPDVTILLDAPIEIGMARARARAAQAEESVDRFELEQLAFFERVRKGFLDIAEQHSRVTRLDASQPLSLIQNQLDKLISREMTQHLSGARSPHA